MPSYDHIFFVNDENRSRGQVIGPAPYLTGLANANAQSSAYFGVTHPSVNNYLALFSGQTYPGITNGCTVGTGTCHTSAPNIADEVIASGRTAKGYMESMPSPCYGPHDAGPYTERHNPFPYFDQIRNDPARCANIVPYTQLASDLGSSTTTPNYVWITPNLINDMHDGTVSQGDAWAQANFPAIFNSPAWTTQHSLLIFTLDEDDGTAGNNVAFFALSSDGTTKTNYTSTVRADHYSALRTIEASWGLAAMTGNDAAASPMSDLFISAPPTPTTGGVTGTVKSTSGGAPITGATVTDTGGASSTTDSSGVYLLTGLTPGSHTLTASASGFTSATQTASLSAGQTTTGINFNLTPMPTTGSVTGTVTSTAGGTAIAGASVADSGGLRTTTDSSGAYLLTGLAPGSHTLTAAASGFTSGTQTASVSAGQTTTGVNFGLAQWSTTGVVTGTVKSSTSGAAITGATVSDSGGGSTTTNRSGAYSLIGLAPGSHSLTASASGFTLATQTASVSAGGTTQGVNFSLAPTMSRAPQLVQESGATESIASTSLTGSFATATSAGHLLVLSASVYTGTSNPITSVTDTGGNTWTRIGAFSSPGHNSDGEMWYAPNAKATTSVTVSTARPAIVALEVQEFSGVATTSPLDLSAGASNLGTVAASGSVSPTAVNTLAVGFAAGHSSAQAISVTAPGYITQAQQRSTSGSTIASVITGYKVVTSISAEAFTGSFSSPIYWAAGIACFRAAP